MNTVETKTSAPDETIENFKNSETNQEIFDTNDGMDIATVVKEEAWEDKIAQQRSQEKDKLEAIRLSLRLLGEKADVEAVPEKEAELEVATTEIFASTPENPEAAETGVGNFSQELLTHVFTKLDARAGNNLMLHQLVESLQAAQPAIEKALERNLAELKGSDAGQTLGEIYSTIEAALPPQYRAELKQEISALAQGQSNPGRLKELASTGLDFIPVVGPGKMLMESIKGQTLAGEKLTGWRRAVHGLEAGTFMIIDTLGKKSGSELGDRNAKKGSEFLSSLLDQSSELAQRAGLTERVSRPMGKAADVVKENPLLANLIDKGFSLLLNRRQQKL